jgi:hypothetical protein
MGDQGHLPDSIVVGDGLPSFRGIADACIDNRGMVTGSGAGDFEVSEHKWANTILGNVRTAMMRYPSLGRPSHLPRYLAAFCDRFNRRFDQAAMLTGIGVAAARTPPLTYRLLKLPAARF